MKFSRAVRRCCGHSIEVSCDGYCTLLTCFCVCRDQCTHFQVTVPGDARRDERLHGAPLYGWCRDCRIRVDDRHIRSLRPQRDARMAIYWLGEADRSDDAFDAIGAAERPEPDDHGTAAAHLQLSLFD
ncbi:MAG TPA: hypothetical protein VFO89_08130 [Thermoanaerobaculia bacterium]|nr:hypothetical protein [Thermoanaerobaculia bacterium]